MHEPARPHRGPYRLHPTVDEVTRRRVGDPNPRGRLERHLGPFFLREGMTAPGAMPFTEALDLVLVEWNRQVVGGNISADIITNYTCYLRGLGRLMTARGLALVSDLSVNFLLMWCLMPQESTGEPASENTSRLRRSAARSFYETAKGLGITDTNPAKTIEFPTRSDRYVKALSDEQVRQMQRVARMTVDDSRTPAALALVMSGATTTEISFVTAADVDVPNRRVWVHNGGYRQYDRWVTLHDDWCVTAVQRRMDDLQASGATSGGDTWLVYQPKPGKSTTPRQGSAGGMIILRLLKFARVHQPGVTRAESIREWLALQVYAETGSLEEVARRLGMSSLDGAAHVVGHNWLTTDAHDRQPPAHRVEGTS